MKYSESDCNKPTCDFRRIKPLWVANASPIKVRVECTTHHLRFDVALDDPRYRDWEGESK